jgi:hypothetical protein
MKSELIMVHVAQINPILTYLEPLFFFQLDSQALLIHKQIDISSSIQSESSSYIWRLQSAPNILCFLILPSL